MSGAERIAAERQRQIEVEGYTAEHDRGQAEYLTNAAIAYALCSEDPTTATHIQDAMLDWWPWAIAAWKPTGDAIRDLTKAGALIAAAIDALEAAR